MEMPLSFAWELAIHALNDLGESAAASTSCSVLLHCILSNRILGRQVLYALTNRQPILGRRFSLLERLHSPEGWNIFDRRRSHQNLLYSYENGGRADLLTCLHPWVMDDGKTWEIEGNRALQLASLASPLVPNALTSAQQNCCLETDHHIFLLIKVILRVDFESVSYLQMFVTTQLLVFY